MALQNLELKITGMTCVHCGSTVANAVKSLDGIQNINVDYRTGMTFIVFYNAKVPSVNIVGAVDETEIYSPSVVNSQME